MKYIKIWGIFVRLCLVMLFTVACVSCSLPKNPSGLRIDNEAEQGDVNSQLFEIFSRARHDGKFDLAKIEGLLNKGADPNNAPYLDDAAFWGNEKLVEILLKHKANPNRLKAGLSSLHQAITNPELNKIKIITLLLDNGANPNIADERVGATPLIYALSEKSSERDTKTSINLEIVKLLLEKGADPNMREQGGYETTPLCIATGAKEDIRVELIALLLSEGADPNQLIQKDHRSNHLSRSLSEMESETRKEGKRVWKDIIIEMLKYGAKVDENSRIVINDCAMPLQPNEVRSDVDDIPFCQEIKAFVEQLKRK